MSDEPAAACPGCHDRDLQIHNRDLQIAVLGAELDRMQAANRGLDGQVKRKSEQVTRLKREAAAHASPATRP